MSMIAISNRESASSSAKAVAASLKGANQGLRHWAELDPLSIDQASLTNCLSVGDLKGPDEPGSNAAKCAAA